VYWAVPTGVFALGAAGFGIAALASYGRAHQIADNSGQYYLSEAQDNVNRGRTFTWITIGAGAVTLGLAIPTAIYFWREHNMGRLVAAPTVGPSHIGIALGGRF
jgi:hypothetical protein